MSEQREDFPRRRRHVAMNGFGFHGGSVDEARDAKLLIDLVIWNYDQYSNRMGANTVRDETGPICWREVVRGYEAHRAGESPAAGDYFNRFRHMLRSDYGRTTLQNFLMENHFLDQVRRMFVFPRNTNVHRMAIEAAHEEPGNPDLSDSHTMTDTSVGEHEYMRPDANGDAPRYPDDKSEDGPSQIGPRGYRTHDFVKRVDRRAGELYQIIEDQQSEISSLQRRMAILGVMAQYGTNMQQDWHRIAKVADIYVADEDLAAFERDSRVPADLPDAAADPLTTSSYSQTDAQRELARRVDAARLAAFRRSPQYRGFQRSLGTEEMRTVLDGFCEQAHEVYNMFGGVPDPSDYDFDDL
ncbi:hypothetical protein GF342_02610 [Candidatus Woesearchaeota archaeon]|nr:hypothetical protein [Candidatus Woesearchaeota archaeon]